jgi:hypothetical protein
MIKKSKADKQKIVKRYISKYEEFYKMPSEDLVILQGKKMSSTDSVALRDAINQKMKEEILNQKLALANPENEENIKDQETVKSEGEISESSKEEGKEKVDN